MPEDNHSIHKMLAKQFMDADDDYMRRINDPESFLETWRPMGAMYLEQSREKAKFTREQFIKAIGVADDTPNNELRMVAYNLLHFG